MQTCKEMFVTALSMIAKNENNPNASQLINAQTKGGVFIQWNI